MPTCVSTRGMHVPRCDLGDGGDDAGHGVGHDDDGDGCDGSHGDE